MTCQVACQAIKRQRFPKRPRFVRSVGEGLRVGCIEALSSWQLRDVGACGDRGETGYGCKALNEGR